MCVVCVFPWLSKYCTWPAKNFSVGRPNEQQWEKKRKIQKRCCIYFVLEPLKEFLFSDPNTKIYWSKTKRLQIASELRKMSLLSINVYGAGKSKNEQKEKCRAKKSFAGLCDIWPNNLVSQKKNHIHLLLIWSTLCCTQFWCGSNSNRFPINQNRRCKQIFTANKEVQNEKVSFSILFFGKT